MGEGSEFIIRLPLAVDEARSERVDEKPGFELAAETATKKKKILVIDDNADAAIMLKTLLEMEGYETEIVFDAESGIKKITEFQPAACLCDIGLPGMDGYELARAVRQLLPDILLISISGWGQ